MATQPKSYPRGSGFVGLRDYLGLNADSRMGDALAEEIETAGRPLARSIQDAGAEFYDKAQRGTPTYQTGQAETMGAEANAGRVVYQGPKSLGDVANADRLDAETGRVSELARMAGTDAGRAALYRQRQGDNGSYTDGGAMLDAAISGRTGGARLANASSAFGRLQDMLGVAQRGATAQANAGQQAAADLSERYRREAPPAKPPGPKPRRMPTLRPQGMFQERADLDAPRPKRRPNDSDFYGEG